MAAAVQCRKEDVKKCKKVLSDLLVDLTDILSLPESMASSDLIRLLACCEVYEIDKTDLFALETVLLEVLEILSSQGVLMDNRSIMTSYRPIVSGRNLRNYLAHDGLVYETVCGNNNPILTLLLNGICLTRYCKVELYSKTATVITQNPKASVAVMYEWSKRLFNMKSNIFRNVENGNYDLLVSDDIELKARDHTNRTVLIAMIDHHSEQFIHYLMGRTSNIKLLVDELIKRGLNQEHNFYDDDEFTLSKLIDQQSVRENMTFYLAVKNHYFELEQELDLLCGGAYNDDSLQLAIIFQNERSALSIIDDSRLYSFCQHEAWNFRNTILTFAVLHKLPNVVRRICEVSPELIECTNTSQETPLRIAVATACKENIEILLAFGAKIFTKNKQPIINALQVRKDEILDILVPSDEELLNNEILLNDLIVNAGSSGHIKLLERLLPMTKSRSVLVQSLHSAAANNQLRATKILLDFDGSIVNELNEFDSTALFRACYSGHDMIVKLLLEKGADCTVPKQNSPLQCAIDQNRHNQFKMMIQRNVIDTDIRNNIIPDLYDLSRYSWIWTALRAGIPCNLTADQAVVRKVVDNSNLEFLFKLVRFRKELIQQINTYILANAVMLGNHKFVKFVANRLYCWNKFDRTRLLNCAVKENDKEMVRLLIDAGCMVNSADAYGITPLATAVSVGKPDMVKFLIKHKADPNMESMGNCTALLDAWNLLSDNIFDQLGGEYYRTYPLILATMHSFRKFAEYLLKEGALADIRDQSGFTALVVAMSHGDVELADALISHGASVDYVRSFSHSLFKGGSALHYSAIYGHLEMAERMIEEYRFDYDVKDSDGNTALHLAVINNQTNFVRYFLDNDNLWNEPNNSGLTPSILVLRQLNPEILNLVKYKPAFGKAVRLFRGSENRTLLHVAVLKGAIDVLQMLLREFDIDSNWMDQFGNTAVYYAVLKKNHEVVQLLMEAGCSLTGPTGVSSMPPFVVAVLTNQLDMVQMYIDKESDAIYHLRQHKSDGKNLLISSIIQNNFTMVKLLIKHVDFDLDSPYENGYTAIHVAATKHSVRMVDLLLQRGSSIDQINGDGKTALMMAIEHGNYRVAHFLLSKGSSKQIAVDYSYRETDGMNLLHFVASTGKLNSLKFLLDREFFARTVTDKKGKTVGHYAASLKQHAIIEFLIASGFPLDQLDNEGRSSLLCALQNEDLRLAKRLKAVGSSLDVVQEYIDKHDFLMRVINGKNINLIKFLTDECCVKVGSVVENVLIELIKTTEHRSLPLDESDQLKQTSSLPKSVPPPIIQHILDGNIPLVLELLTDESAAEAVRTYRMATRDQETLLHVAARMGYSSILRLLLEKAVFNIDVGDVDQTTALQEAATRGQKSCAELLLQHGANINFVDLQNTTALTRACLNSQKDVAELLLDQGANLDNTKAFRIETQNGATALHIAVLGDLSLIELLIRKVGLDVNITDAGGQTALHFASSLGSIQAVEELLKLGACADVIDNDRKTPFVVALVSDHEEVAERLLAETQDEEYLRSFRMTESLKSVLHLASEKGFVRLISQLLNNRGLNARYTDNEGKAIPHLDLDAGNEASVQQLKSDLDMIFLKDIAGETPLSICLSQSNHDVFAAIIQSSISSGTLEQLINNIKKGQKQTHTKFVELFNKWLLDYGNKYTKDHQFFTSMISRVYETDPLVYAIHGDHKDLLNLFLQSTVDRSILQDLNPATWLHVAAVKNLYLLAKVMLDDFKIDVDRVDNHGMTPLCYAVTTPHTETARFLMDRGANVNFQDPAKRTPLQTALELNNKDMVQLLLERHASIPLLQEFRYRNDNEHLVQHYIVERGLTEMLSLILPKIDVSHGDKFGMTPLHYAAGCNQLEMIGLLVRAGAEVDCFDVHRTTPLMRALSKNHLEAYHMLVGLGANVDLVRQFRNDNFDGETVLHITAEKNRFAATKLLVEDLECDINCVDNDGNTPLHCAVQKGSFDVVKYLLGKNANIHVKNKGDKTVLQLLEEVNFNVNAYAIKECE
nr:uncharacterized protein LOC109399519 [Aedes albopictus]